MEAQRIPKNNFVFLQPRRSPVYNSELKKSNHPCSLTFLVISEDEALFKSFRQIRQLNYNFIAATHRDAVRAALQCQPQLIFVSLDMPLAVQVCSTFKCNTSTNDIPLVLITSAECDGDRMQAYEAGVDDYISGPADFNEIFVRAWNLIRNRQMLREKFLYFFKKSDKSLTSTDDRFLQRALQVMEKYLGESSFGVNIFAREVGISTTQLYRKLTHLTGYTPNDLIRCIRLQRASDLLEQRAGNIAEVAYQVGFNNLSYFSKCFKQKFNRTPSEYLNSRVSQ